MFRRSNDKYVVLQDHVPLREQRATERAVVTVLQPVKPSHSFVQQLSYDLIEEAKREQEMRHHLHTSVRIMGLMGGGLLSILGGILVWLLVRNRDEATSAGSA